MPLPTNRQRASLHGCCSVQPCQHAAIGSISAGSCAGVWSLIAQGCIHQTSRPTNLSAATPLATKSATVGGCTKRVGSSTGANFDSQHHGEKNCEHDSHHGCRYKLYEIRRLASAVTNLVLIFNPSNAVAKSVNPCKFVRLGG
jgi:hypothetical protein